MNYAALKSEILTDPAHLGYAPFVAAGNDAGVAALLNATTGPGAATVTVPSLPSNDFLLAIAPAYLSLPNLSTAIQTKWDRILNVLTGADRVDLTDQRNQQLIGVAVTDGVLTSAQAQAIGQRTGSRAEVLFGAGTVVGQADVSMALRGS